MSTIDQLESDMRTPPLFHWPANGRFQKETSLHDDDVNGDFDSDGDIDMTVSDIMKRQSVPLASAPPNALRKKGSAAPIEEIRWHTNKQVVQPGDFLIVVADEAPGFWVCQVVKVISKKANGELLEVPKFSIVWWSTKNKTGFGVYTEYTLRTVPQTGVVDMDMIMFVLDNLTSGKQIPRNVQTEMKSAYKERLVMYQPGNKQRDDQPVYEHKGQNDDPDSEVGSEYDDC